VEVRGGVSEVRRVKGFKGARGKKKPFKVQGIKCKVERAQIRIRHSVQRNARSLRFGRHDLTGLAPRTG